MKSTVYTSISQKQDGCQQHYLESKRCARKTLKAAKADQCDDVSEKLDTRVGERLKNLLARSLQRQNDDVEKFYGFNDEHGHFLMDRKHHGQSNGRSNAG